MPLTSYVSKIKAIELQKTQSVDGDGSGKVDQDPDGNIPIIDGDGKFQPFPEWEEHKAIYDRRDRENESNINDVSDNLNRTSSEIRQSLHDAIDNMKESGTIADKLKDSLTDTEREVDLHDRFIENIVESLIDRNVLPEKYKPKYGG